jgi:oligoendopeptidase F
MPQTASGLPRWDMAVVYPGLESPEFARDFRGLADAVADLGALFDAQGIGLRDPAPLDSPTVASFETVTARFNAILEAAETIDAYLYAFVATDSRDTVAQARQSEYEQLATRLSQLGTRFTAWLGSLDIETLIQTSPLAAEHAYPLRRAHAQAKHLMSPVEEELAAELRLTGGIAWQKLWGNVSSQLAVPIEREGQTVQLPMSAVRNLAYESDRALRRQAYEAELATWQRAAVPLAAAMNSIKGEVSTLARRRGWESPLAEALFVNGIDRPVLEAMLGAAREHFPVFRRYLRAKARALGLQQLT